MSPSKRLRSERLRFASFPVAARTPRSAPVAALAAALLLTAFPAELGGQSVSDSTEGEGRSGAAQAVVATPGAGDPRHGTAAPRLRALRAERTEAGIQLDGRLDEPAWSRAPVADRFVQREPEEGVPATQRTEVRFLHDGHTLYIGARMYDELGAEGVTGRLVRRDGQAQSDELELSFDPFHDHVSQTVFSINPAGVRGDSYGPGGSNPDPSWDPVWQSAVRVDEEGWTAELAIPFSQLRFPRNGPGTWGLQMTRTVNRLNEVSVWSFWRRGEQGGPARYGHLDGMTDIQAAATRFELLPYAVSQLDVRGTADPDDPFRSETAATMRAGADLTYLINSNLTLNATVNPDFGQVEVDPAVVNLTAFETFFPEKREFFIQGQGRFGFGSFWCIFCSNASSLNMLFTRRIGRRPQAARLAEDAGEFADVPTATTILAAAKVTGQTEGGSSLGALGAVTGRERARVRGFDGSTFHQEVEPLTGYFAGRVKRDLLDGELQVGGMLTAVARDFDDPALEDRLNRHSEGAGVDAEYWWGDQTYHLLFSAVMTNISGTPEAIDVAQRSSARYFQRPDRKHGGNGLFTDRYDPTLTSMRGWGLYSRVAKDAGPWRWETALNARSPGFENNDIAFLTRTDFIWMNANVARQWATPGSWYREIFAILGGQQEYNFDGDLTQRQLQGYFFFQTPFYWNVNAFLMWRPSVFDDRLTRGGPVVKAPEEMIVSTHLSTDSRKPVIVGTNPQYAWDAEGGSTLSVPLDLTLKPRSNVSVTLSPTYRRTHTTDQFVTSTDDPTAEAFYGRRYVFADLRQESLSLSTRVAWTFSPGMSLEAFVQPFIAANDFSRYKEFVAPRELEKRVYGEHVGTVRSEGTGQDRAYFVDPDGEGPADELSFDDPDFVLRSLRGSAVFRWEWRPGSTLFLVWTQDRASRDPSGTMDLSRDGDAVFSAAGDHVLLAKITWWLGL